METLLELALSIINRIITLIDSSDKHSCEVRKKLEKMSDELSEIVDGPFLLRKDPNRKKSVDLI